jgi:phosphohistidine phosphatase
MRHAKSDWSGSGVSDFNRPINKRGHKNAKRIGQWMVENNRIPQQIISSSALRAKQTTELVEKQLIAVEPVKVFFDKDLYLASAETLIESIQLYKKEFNSLMLVAHNPGMEQLLNMLLMISADTAVENKTMTTANLAIFEYDDSDFEPEKDKGKLLAFIKPKELD